MGKFEKGILGHFNGKVGTVVGSSWKGIDYMKSKNRKSKKPKTPAQLRQQARFSLVAKFVATLSRLVKDSFNDPSDKMTGSNMALALNMEKAIIGDYPFYEIDYTRVAVSKGILHNVFSPVATAAGSGIIKYSWTKFIDALAGPNDIAVMVAYCPELDAGVFGDDGSVRTSETGGLNALIFSGKEVHTWILFFSPNRDAVSGSLHTGTVTVS